MKTTTYVAVMLFALLSFKNVIAQEIGVTGNGTNTITDNSGNSPSATNHTNFAAATSRTFTITNTKSGSPSTLHISSIVLSNTTDFTISSPLGSASLGKGASSSFTISAINPNCGTYTSTVTIASDATNDGTDNVWIFSISVTTTPEINLVGNGISIANNDLTPSGTDNTDFGSIEVGGSSSALSFTIQNTGSCALNLNGSPIILLSNATDFTVDYSSTTPAVSAGGNTAFTITFNPTTGADTLLTCDISISNTDSDEGTYIFRVQGTGITPLTSGPGGVTNHLKLWLKSTDGLGYTDGQKVALWQDQGRGADATVNTAGQEPTYRDNPAYNVNFNPVIDFDNDYVSVATDGDYSFDNTNTQFLEGTGGMYTQDIFVVLIPDVTVNNNFGSMDVFCGDRVPATNQTDATGIGLGAYTSRFSGEILCYALGTTSSGSGYGVAEIGTGNTYNNVGIINTRNNTAATQQELYYNANNKGTNHNDLPDFANVNDSRYWIGRSEGWEASTDARIGEIITYSARKDDSNLASERNRIQSYLAIKYGITLGVNGTSQDYVNSDGTVIWDQSVNIGYNYDIAGIGKDDDSGLVQKQSKSTNSTALVAIGLGELASTNSANSNSFATDKDFLIWGNSGAAFSTAAESAVTISLNQSSTTFTPVSRKWKIHETQNDVTEVVLSLKTSDLTANIPLSSNERHVLVVSDNASFVSANIVDVIPFEANGSNSEVWYDFDGTKFFTIAKASKVEAQRHIDFSAGEFLLGDSDLDLNSNFTLSAWVKNNANGGNFISKGTGYQFEINSSKKVQISWNGSTQLTSTTSIPDGQWHHIALIYSSNTANLYIDGVLDTTVNSLTNPASNTHRFTIGALYNNKSNITSFDGSVDEVRVWNTNLSVDEVRYIMNQEIETVGSNVNGKVLPSSVSKNAISARSWSNLDAYFDMNSFYGTTVEDLSNNQTYGRIKYLNKSKQIVNTQSTPLPYKSTSSGDWDSASTWMSGTELTIPGEYSIVDNTITVDWNIVRTSHDVTMNNAALPIGNNENRTLLGLLIDSNELTVEGETSLGSGYGLTISHYLKIDGVIDLEGESQLIQNQDSDLDETSSGTIERDQQGTKDLFTYNYWCSPVGNSNTTSNNNSFSIPNIFRDGTNPASPAAIAFLSSGYNGAAGSPVSIADYWIWKYANRLGDTYSQWQHMRSTGTIYTGEGFTMKGVENTSGNISLEQNYVFAGKPNNGDITLTVAAGNDYLVGNPYASALDADEFIKDNISTAAGGRNSVNVINGALYFWDHFARSTHALKEYAGGYAVYTLMGGVPAVNNDSRISATGETGTKIPQRYVPVGQGFFVFARNSGTPHTVAPVGGDILFKNSQRAFQKESGGASLFVKKESTKSKTTASKASGDIREKIRLIYKSPKGYYRHVLAGVDSNASQGYDIGYDAPNNDNNIEDLFWTLNDGEKLLIQAVDNFDAEQTLPFTIKTSVDGVSSINIETLENMDPNQDIFIFDKTLNTYHNLKEGTYEVFLTSGEHENRFEMTFTNNTSLNTDKFGIDDIRVLYSTDKQSFIIHNPKLKEIKSAEVFNILGQSTLRFDSMDQGNYHELHAKNLSTGAYIIKINSAEGNLTKKVIVD